MSLPGRAMKSSNNYRSGSNAITDINQGGGSKKAGLYPSVAKDSWASIYFGTNNLGKNKNACRSLSCMQFTVNPGVKLSRPISSWSAPNTYWSGH